MEYLNFIKRIWVRIIKEPFVSESFLATLRLNGGHDLKALRNEDLLALLEGRFDGNWKKVGFSFGEMSAYYLANVANLSKEELCAWAFSVIVLGQAIRYNGADLGFSYRQVLTVLIANDEIFELEESLYILKSFLFDSGSFDRCSLKIP